MAVGGGGRQEEERVAQWGPQETRGADRCAGEVERHGGEQGRRRAKETLWEAVAARLRERGYRRTPDQCKCKWKNLLNRYKGKETSDPENGRQCPFFEELHAVFTERERKMQRQLTESGTSIKKKLKRSSGGQSSEESADEEDEEETDDERSLRSRKRTSDDKRQQPYDAAEKSWTNTSSIHDLLQDFLQQQQHMDIQWQQMMERRAQERLISEQEWRQLMQKLEQERLMLEQAWMEHEEQMRIREEARVEKSDALLTTLLNKLLQEDL